MSTSVPTALRNLVRERAQGRCEYCQLHEDLAGDAYEVDHIIARKHRGPTSGNNLAWTCFLCNSAKGTDIASIDVETGALVRLFNPRIDKWSSHFRVDEGRIIPLSPEGRVTEYLLQLNRSEFVEYRRLLMAAGRYP